ncbi:MAG TPA: tRNA dihydrouridine synthase DusB [Clostridia bacterium]|nr:tRNA dihydrouridine synthase DusB [Clostridia bacterium]
MKIGNAEIKGYTALAPMAGVADHAMRILCHEFGASYLVGEMASAKGLCMSDRKTSELLAVTPGERPMAVQLFGSDPAVMAQAAKKALEYGPDVIDINMGCPAPKVAGNGGGSSLMKDPVLAGRILEAVVHAVNVPVTVKIRKGWDDKSVNAVEIAEIAEANGAAAITVHGRTREQMYAPPVDLEIIARVKEAVGIPVIGNGDVRTPEGAKKMLEATGCDLVMIGRGALGTPWIFSQTESYLNTGRYEPAPPVRERMNVMLRHIRMLCEFKGEFIGMKEARKHAAWYLKGMIGAAALRNEAGKLSVYRDIEILAEKVIRAGNES